MHSAVRPHRDDGLPFLSFEHWARGIKSACKHLARRTGWAYESVYPAELAVLDGFHGIWFSDELTICPQCIASRYHSHWHQLRGLERCPWHGSRLERACKFCGGTLGRYAATPSMCRAPYACSTCEAAYAAEVFDPETGALWKMAETVDQAFAAQRRWAWRTAATLRRFYPGITQLAENEIGQWWSVPAAVGAIARLLTEAPPGCIVPKEPITYLVWPLRSSTDTWTGDSLYRTAWNNHAPLQTYIDVLQILRTWILDTCVLPETTLTPVVFVNGRILITDWPPAALAYMVLRLTWENPETWSPLAEIQVRQLLEPSQVQRCWNDVIYDSRTTRALMFATFAALYWMVRRTRKKKSIFPYRATDQITTAYLGVAGDQKFGAVWFPTIPGVIEEEARDPGYLNLDVLER